MLGQVPHWGNNALIKLYRRQHWGLIFNSALIIITKWASQHVNPVHVRKAEEFKDGAIEVHVLQGDFIDAEFSQIADVILEVDAIPRIQAMHHWSVDRNGHFSGYNNLPSQELSAAAIPVVDVPVPSTPISIGTWVLVNYNRMQ